jgi:N-methylhydantoinase B/oxoprolinase/acetone carboxylase alpha subunit
VQDSGGPGKYRGGLGYRRTLLATQVEINGSQCSDRHVVKPWALFGGAPGGNGATVIQKAGSDQWQTVKVSSSKYANIKLQPGDRIQLTTPGGGGYGDPRERESGGSRRSARGLRLRRERPPRLRLSFARELIARRTTLEAMSSKPQAQRSGYLGCQSRFRYSFS